MNKTQIIGEMNKQLTKNFYSTPKIKGLTITEEEQVGGEGEGDHYHYVFKVTDGNESMFVMATAWYDSYNGCMYDKDISEVVPYEKTVRDWNRV